MLIKTSQLNRTEFYWNALAAINAEYMNDITKLEVHIYSETIWHYVYKVSVIVKNHCDNNQSVSAEKNPGDDRGGRLG